LHPISQYRHFVTSNTGGEDTLGLTTGTAEPSAAVGTRVRDAVRNNENFSILLEELLARRRLPAIVVLRLFILLLVVLLLTADELLLLVEEEEEEELFNCDVSATA
jgi:hypothetical protein